MDFLDRPQAGEQLAARLARYRGDATVIVLALPRGGVPVAAPVARALAAPLDVFVVRKLGAPFDPEYAIGALASGGVRVMNPEADTLALRPADVEAVVAREQQELQRRERLYRGTRAPLALAGRTVLLVDDGLATGSTMLAAVRAVRQQSPGRIVVAVPVGSAQACASLRQEADEVLCLATPQPFGAVGMWYRHFGQTSDEEVQALLAACPAP